MMIDKIALALLVIGGLNWGCVGLFQFDLVAFICGGSGSMMSRVIYTIIGLSAVWCISLLFRDTPKNKNSPCWHRRKRGDIDRESIQYRSFLCHPYFTHI